MKRYPSYRLSTILLLAPLFMGIAPAGTGAQEAWGTTTAFGSVGWFAPTSKLALPDPTGSVASLQGSPFLTVGVQGDLARILPPLRLSISRVLGSDLLLEQESDSQSLGSVDLTSVLLEAVFRPVESEVFGLQTAVGGGVVRYDFPEMQDQELSAFFGRNALSPVLALSVGGLSQFGRFGVLVDAADWISIYDSPAVDTGSSSGQTTDRDLVQHDLRFSVGIKYLFRQ